MKKLFEKQLPPGVSIKKNPSEALVYDILEGNEARLSKKQFRETFGSQLESAAKPENTAIRVLSEGDSWVNILWPLSSLFGHERTFFDVVERHDAFYTKDFAYPGDRFEDILEQREYITDLKSASYEFFVFSGGGNDVLGGGALRKFLRDRNTTDPNDPADTWFNITRVNNALQKITKGYEQLAQDTQTLASGRTQLLIHGYDYPIPRSGEPWLGEPLEDRGYNLNKDALQIAEIFKFLVDKLYDSLDQVAKNHANVQLMDLRNIVGSRWNDELHPKTEASFDIAQKYIDQMTGNIATS